jgi:putative transposase
VFAATRERVLQPAQHLDCGNSPTLFPHRVGSCSGIEILLTACRAPNMNAFAERFVRTIKSEYLSQIVFVWRGSLDRAISEFVARYHDERSHQGIGNEIVSGAMPQRIGQIKVSERLGGLLNYYHRRAA